MPQTRAQPSAVSPSVPAQNLHWPRHLIGARELSGEAAEDILERAASYRKKAAEGHTAIFAPPGQVTLVNLFLENSTRTRLSFEIAGQRLGMGVVNMSAEGSSILKGESLVDTIQTLLAMRPRALVVRHSESGTAALAAGYADPLGCAVLNAGDGTGEHPTQALLDAATIADKLGRIQGRRVVICGDIVHSRVARSNAWLLPKLGADVVLCGPPEFLPGPASEGWDMPAVAMTQDFDAALKGADAVMMLRIQRERLQDGMSMPIAEYQNRYRLDHARLARSAPGAFAMAPGPINREIEISGALADDAARSLILDQVTNGIFVRMAALAMLVSARRL